jgi:peptidoglycan/LPS O-acetylase OafA/YrhL
MIIAALALALQPDRAMAGTLLAGLLVVAMRQRGVGVVTALAAAMIGFVVTLLRPDDLPATPFVERVVADAFTRSAVAGGALVAGVALLLLPACNRGEPARVFAAVWLAIFLAAMVGNYPTPLLGYGGSGIIGYLISLAALPAHARPAPVDRGGAGLDAPGTQRRNDHRLPAMAAPRR